MDYTANPNYDIESNDNNDFLCIEWCIILILALIFTIIVISYVDTIGLIVGIIGCFMLVLYIILRILDWI